MTTKPYPHRTRRTRRPDGRAQARALGRLEVFARCTHAELRRIDALTCEAGVPAGSVLVREGASPRQVLFLVEGSVVVTSGDAELGSYGPGACIGGREVAAVLAHPATVTARTALTVRAATPAEFRSLITIPALAELVREPPVLGPREAPARVGGAGDENRTRVLSLGS
jgi:CRP-like cAMP-binding protein